MTSLAKKKRVEKQTNGTSPHTSALPTLMDHLRELQGRLFSTVIVFILIAGAAYPFFDDVTKFLLAPLKPGQELVYLTPGGAFGFIIKVCCYIGLIGTLPMIIFHVYRFIMPAVRQTSIRTVLKYTIASLVLAITGVLFAYYVSLPAALQFLTGFNLNHIDPMLTIDSYFSFIMTYMLAGALLFQLPLIMLIVNSVTPLTPKKLMGFQSKMVIISFVVAAIISPTPDALNQTLLASPMVVMYQLGILMIWRINAKKAKKARLEKAHDVTPVKPREVVFASENPASRPAPALTSTVATPIVSAPAMRRPVKSMDMVQRPRMQRVAVPARPVTQPSPMPAPRAVISSSMSRRTIDGVVRMRQRTV